MLIGILADTHIPYRASEIPISVINAFHDVDVILHAGDVDEPEALIPLEKIAPVYAVSGNYHILDKSSGGRQFPSSQTVSVCGQTIFVTHGHLSGWSTIFWRFASIFAAIFGKANYLMRDQFISRRLVRLHPDVDIIIFGHTHRFYTTLYQGKLVINPGAACAASYFTDIPETTVALLKLDWEHKPIVSKIVV
jgi:predicted phosphodiesterase